MPYQLASAHWSWAGWSEMNESDQIKFTGPQLFLSAKAISSPINRAQTIDANIHCLDIIV